MNRTKLRLVAEKMYAFLPLFDRKLIKPFELFAKPTVTPVLFHTMVALKDNSSLTMSELAREMGISKQQLTQVIDKLMEQGFVTRQNDARDRRIVHISLSKTGVEFFERHKKQVVGLLSQEIGDLNSKELNRLERSLDQVLSIIGGM